MTTNFERKMQEISSFYTLNDTNYPCVITRISFDGIEMSVKGCLYYGDNVKVRIGKESVPAKVERVEGVKIGLRYCDIPRKQFDSIFSYTLGLSKGPV